MLTAVYQGDTTYVQSTGAAAPTVIVAGTKCDVRDGTNGHQSGSKHT